MRDAAESPASALYKAPLYSQQVDKITYSVVVAPSPKTTHSHRFGTGPFYAVKVYAGDIGTALGIAANENAQALDNAGQVIPGLYVAGNDMHSVMVGQWRGDLLAFLSSLGPVKNTIVIDQRAADPEETRVLSGKLADIGISLVDAPIHCELASDFPESSAILCGGALESIEKIRPVLEAMAPKVIYLGETGTGHTAHALVSAVGVCNRFITYECAALGFKNGLAIEDMSTVLNHSSGANSATERILPLLATGERTTDIPITDVASVLRIISRLAMRVGAPAMLPLFVAELSQSLANQSAPGSTLDDALEMLELASGVRFAQ